jgi:3-oxoadipate enol-lactonase
MSFAELNDARIHYELAGPTNLPALVFSNSLGTTYSMWDAQMPEFQKHFRILRYDTRGHGESPVTPGPYNAEKLSRDVLGLLDDLQIDQVYFCGLSMGGMTGMWLGINAPKRLHKLVLCNTAAKFGTQEFWNGRIEKIRAAGMKAVAPVVVERWFTPGFRERARETVAATLRELENSDLEGYIANCEAVRDFDEREGIAKIRVPTLVIAGAHDPSTPPEQGRFIASKIPGARYVELNAAHLSNIEDCDRFNSEVSAFLRA